MQREIYTVRGEKRERVCVRERVRERKRYHPTVIILVPSIKIPYFFAKHRPERNRHSI